MELAPSNMTPEESVLMKLFALKMIYTPVKFSAGSFFDIDLRLLAPVSITKFNSSLLQILYFRLWAVFVLICWWHYNLK